MRLARILAHERSAVWYIGATLVFLISVRQLGAAIAVGVIGLVWKLYRWRIGKSLCRTLSEAIYRLPPLAATDNPAAPAVQVISPKPDMHELIEQLFATERYPLLLRPSISKLLTPDQFTEAVRGLHRDMILIGLDEAGSPDVNVSCRPLFFAHRHPVNGEYFRRFVDTGGYGDATYWHPGHWDPFPAPAYPVGSESDPMRDVSWYEADAYARWLGARLPSESEWNYLRQALEMRGQAITGICSHDGEYDCLWEWTASDYHFASGTSKNPERAKILRRSSAQENRSCLGDLRSSLPGCRDRQFGFRCILCVDDLMPPNGRIAYLPSLVAVG